MSRRFDIECMVIRLEELRDLAVKLKFDQFFISEINHMIATVKANQ